MLKKNLIIVAIMSLTLISAVAVLGQPTRQKARSLGQPNSSTRTNPSVFDRFGDRDPPALNKRSGRPQRNIHVNKDMPGGNNLTKTGTGTLGWMSNKNPELNRSRIPRGGTTNRIIMANTEGDFHLKAKTSRGRKNDD